MESKKQIPSSIICFKEMKATLWSSDDGQLHTTSWKAVAFDISLLWTSSLLKKKKKTRRKGNAKSLSYLRNQLLLLLFQNWVLLTWKLLWTHLDSFEVEEILLTFSNGNVKSFISTTHYRENELGIPKKINEKRVMQLGMVYQFKVFFFSRG